MATVNCPNCDTKLEFYIGPAVAQFVRPAKYDSLISDVDGQIAEEALRAVLAFMRSTGPGRYPSRLLFGKYQVWRAEFGGPALGQGGFGRALSLCGAEQARTAKQREWEIPENINTIEPVRPYIDSRRAERAAHREAVGRRTGVDKSPAVDPLTDEVVVLERGPDGKNRRIYQATSRGDIPTGRLEGDPPFETDPFGVVPAPVVG